MNEMHPLGKLIQASQDRNGWSTRDLQRMAEQRGYNMTHSNFSRLKNEDVVSIKGSIIKLLSEVLGLPETKIARAAMASMGVDLQIDEVAVDEAVRNSDEFSERDRRIITSVLDAMRETQSETSNEDQDKPETNPPSKRTLRAIGPRGEVSQGQKTSSGIASSTIRMQAYRALNTLVKEAADKPEVTSRANLDDLLSDPEWYRRVGVPEDMLIDATAMRSFREIFLNQVGTRITMREVFDQNQSVEEHLDWLESKFQEALRSDPAYLTPPPIEQLAAHPHFKTQHEKFEEAYGERGEENQDGEP